MIVRDLEDDSAFISSQEDHAELAAQIAAHWGNGNFKKLIPYETMIFATLWHDSGYRDWEGCPPVNEEKGRPFGHREISFFPQQLEGYIRNIDWVRDKDCYAGLIVSMHRTGLWQNRYKTITSPPIGHRSMQRRPEIQVVLDQLEADQNLAKEVLSKDNKYFDQELWINYRLLQVYDLLSLYFCCDGFVEEKLIEQTIAPVPVGYDTQENVKLQLIPNGHNAVKIAPYPFDISPFTICLRARQMPRRSFVSQEECREAYYKASRCFLEYEINN